MSQASRRYVIVHHAGIASPHFDLLFEWEPGEPLTSFRCPAWPPSVGDVWDERPDHRRLYLDYEGPIDGDRGRVARVATGTIRHATLASDPPSLALAFDGLAVTIANVVDGDSLTRWVVQTRKT